MLSRQLKSAAMFATLVAVVLVVGGSAIRAGAAAKLRREQPAQSRVPVGSPQGAPVAKPFGPTADECARLGLPHVGFANSTGCAQPCAAASDCTAASDPVCLHGLCTRSWDSPAPPGGGHWVRLDGFWELADIEAHEGPGWENCPTERQARWDGERPDASNGLPYFYCTGPCDSVADCRGGLACIDDELGDGGKLRTCAPSFLDGD